jgi:hypothetical protein
MQRTHAQNARLHQLLGQLGLTNDKAALVRQHTNGRTERSSEMSYAECAGLIGDLERAAGSPSPMHYPSQPAPQQPAPAASATPQREKLTPEQADSANRMRRKVFALAREAGMIWGETAEDKRMNAAKMDAFLMAHGYIKQPLNAFTFAQLPKLVTQFEQIVKHNARTAASRAVRDLVAGTGVTTPSTPRRPRAPRSTSTSSTVHPRR